MSHLVKSSGGYQYILVVCDYATRFPEAFPLRTITVPAVMRAPVQLFSRVGVPDEILTDKGTDFTARLMQLVHKQLGISTIKTTPYHPQTVGLVERFNQTLKRMLKKFVNDTGKDWDRWLPFLLFAHREVTQASTGFSPFELLYGWGVQGPLDLLRKGWEAPSTSQSESKVLMVRSVNLEEEMEAGPEMLTEAATPVLDHLPPEKARQLLKVFNEAPSLFGASPGKTNLVEHVICLKEGQPIRQRPYRVPQQLVEKLQQEVEEMLRLRVIEPSYSEWCSPVVIIFKKDGSLRICIDFRKLNSISEFDAYPMPRIDDLLEKIGAAKYIGTLDLCKGYWQVLLERSSRTYTAFRTPAGLFQVTVMPFGLHGAAATFQRLMDRVLQGCENYSAAYLDDVVIVSNTWEEHVQHLSLVLEKIQQAGLALNPGKCEWARQETKYLGYRLGRGEIRPQVDKVEAIQNCLRPSTKKEVRSFLGLVGWYRRFVPQFATIAAPLTALTCKDQRNPVTWTDECEEAFKTLKNQLCASPVLRSPDFSQRFLVQVDASAVGLGAVLAQGDPGEERPILYLSRKMQPRKTRYSTVEKEGLAIKWALEGLRYYLLGREFDLETDHRALTWINSMKDHKSRLTRWYLSLQPYRFMIRHRSGKANVVADYLSRLAHSQPLGGEG